MWYGRFRKPHVQQALVIGVGVQWRKSRMHSSWHGDPQRWTGGTVLRRTIMYWIDYVRDGIAWLVLRS
jgi:hypothetical protein